jgi:peptidylglycine monooxygenase
MKIAGYGHRGEQVIRMPNSKPNLPETYLCTPLKLDLNESVYITGFEPKADKNTAHHMILFGCQMPGKTDPVFHCGAMDAGQQEDSPTTSPCANGTSIIYAWAQNAPKLHLPKDVGFRVGGEGSNVVWLVLQVKHAFIRNIYSIDVITLGQINSDHYNRFITLTKLTLPLFNLIGLNKAIEKWSIVFSLIV